MPLKDYCKPLEDVLDELRGKDERDEWPKRKDLHPDKIYINKTNLDDTQTLLNGPRYCLIEGAERRGKTTLARYIGLQYLKNWNVFRIDVSQVRDENDLNEFINQMSGGTLDLPNVLIIIEDCHIKPEITEKLLKNISGCRKAHFLLTTRTVKETGKLSIEDPFQDSKIRENDWVVRLDVSKETILNNIKGIVDKFVENNKADLIRQSKPVPTYEDHQCMVEKTGGNKRILKYYLDTWLKTEASNLPLREVDSKQICKRFEQERLRRLGPNQLEVLKTMSVLGQFEIPILIQPLFPSEVLNATQVVSSLKGLAFKLSPESWLLADTEAKLTLECMNVSDYFIFSILKKYALGATNYYEVFRALHRAQEQELLILLANDAELFNSLILRLSNDKTPLGEMLYVLRAIAWADKAKALNLWREYKKQAGEPFFEAIKRKLFESHEIGITMGLLNLLQTLDKEGEEMPLANILPVELFISKSQLEIIGFRSFFNKLYKYRSLAPEIAKKVLKYLSNSDYRKLGEKAKNHSLQNISWFLHLLAAQTESKAAIDDFLKGLGLNVFLDMIMSSPFTVVGRTIDFLYAIAPEEAVQVLRSLEKSDYERLGESARSSSLQRINWFLRHLGDNEALKGFGTIFLEAIGTEKIVEMVKSSNISIFSDFEQYANKVIPGWVSTLIGRPDFSWDELLNKSPVHNMANSIYGWIQSHDLKLREQRKNIVRHWSTQTGGLNLGLRQKIQPVKHLGRLLLYSYYLDEDAAKNIAIKAITAFEPETMMYTLEQLAYLLKNSRWCNPDTAQRLVEKIFSNDATSLLSKGDLNGFCQLLWEAALSNDSRTKDWVTEVRVTFWEDLAVNSPLSETFWLLLVLWQANEELGRRVTNSVGRQLLTLPKLMDDPQAMPLLGLFSFCGLEPQVALFFSPEENVDKLCVHPASQRLACSLSYLQGSKPEAIPSLIKAILTLRLITPSIALLLAEHQLPWTASALADILVSVRSESRREREDIYDRMLLIFRTIRRRAYLNTMLNEMCTPQFAPQSEPTLEAEGDIEREEERIHSWATIRLMNAIDKGIFTVQKTEDPITHKASQILNLNWSYSQVTFTFDVTGNLLLALRDAQRDKGWADYETWIIRFRRIWKGQLLPPQQLRYWQGILLKMNMVNVDYKEIDKEKWVITFQVNDKHLLARSIILSK